VKKRFLPLVIGLLLTLTPSLANAASEGSADITPLSNKDVLSMVQSHLSEDAIIKTIKSSPCTFDVFPPVLKDMKRRGVSDAVLQAMIDAPYGPSVQMASAKDDLGDQPIYHYAEQLKALGYVVPSKVGPAAFKRQSARSRTSRR
jgi:hypothetical protein